MGIKKNEWEGLFLLCNLQKLFGDLATENKPGRNPQAKISLKTRPIGFLRVSAIVKRKSDNRYSTNIAVYRIFQIKIFAFSSFN
ncbi:hypothetical protein L596_011347 [Steinernema carpocapsae]|uniref:Uncharacterized protein n=1 Tax=Steinernema carpocapsae TaxID=34508 RepID=A0A4U5NUH2_STECR|nr:hypothetical protein L596_011347 [Steinernema carpocapsae]